MAARELLYDWNRDSGEASLGPPPVVDETLRDGLQGGVPRQPGRGEKLDLLERIEGLGVREAVVGFPARAEALDEALGLARGARARGLGLRLGLLGRMRAADLESIATVRDASEASVVAWLFVGSSGLRGLAEGWRPEALGERCRTLLARAAELGLPVNLGLEDGARAEPVVIEALVRVAVEERVETVTICDTVGWLTPPGCRRVVSFARQLLGTLERRGGRRVGLDFHGHSDRGLALANSLMALRSGADRVHGTALGIGERAGNAPLDLLLVNLELERRWHGDLRGVAAYVRAAAAACGTRVPARYPVFGARAFRTEAGVHADTIQKARERCAPELAPLVYGAMDPAQLGRELEIAVGPASGRANLRHVLARQGIALNEFQLRRVLQRIRGERGTLDPLHLRRLALEESRGRPGFGFGHGPPERAPRRGEGETLGPAAQAP